MADEDKSGTNLASGSVIFVALVSAGFYFFHREAPLVDLRPAGEAHVVEHAAPGEIVARLWQDPIGAVDKFREKSGTQEAERKCQDNPGVGVAPCVLPVKGTHEKTFVLGVAVPGGPYLEDSERRLRTRFAVLAGLEQAGFVPEDSRHIGYFVWTQTPSVAPPLAESLTKLPLLACDALPCNHSNRVTTASVRPESSAPLFCLLHGTSVHVGRTLPHAAFGEPAIVPYEKFTDATKNDPSRNRTKSVPDSVLVLWLKEDLLKGRPLTELDALVGLLNRDQHPTVKFIGPSSSDMLHEMVNEALAQNSFSCGGPKGHWKNLEGINFYAYLASVPDKYLLGKLYDSKSCTLQKYLDNFGINLERTIATEDAIAEGIRHELALRRIRPSSEVKDHIALISEWDTYYGQTLPQSVEQAFAHDDLEHPWIHKFTYLRGLDGLLPSTGSKEEPKQDKSTTAGDKPGSTPDFFRIEKDTQSLERPIGESQYDYLRRISGRLHKIDDELRKGRDKDEEQNKIKAIGILGGDIFDKLLILRALRLEFPEALFFTNDYDEAFRIKSELPFTRNLIISSSFGPNLSEWLQGDIPSFRDTGETSAFLATQLAIGHLPQDLEKPSNLGPDLSAQLHAPRLFEITRTGGVVQFAWRELSPRPARPTPPPHNNERKYEDGPKVSGDPIETGRSAFSPLKGNDATNTGRNVQIDALLKPVNPENSPNREPCWSNDDTSSCGYIQPVDIKALSNWNAGDPKVIEKLFPTYENNSRITLAVALAIFALGASGVLLGSRYVRENVFVETILLILGLGIGSVLCFKWEFFAQLVTANGDGTPILILEGVSVWPTILLRALGIVLSLYFIYRALRGLHENLAEEIADKMELSPKPEAWLQQLARFKKDVLTFKRDILGFLLAVWKGLSSLFHSPRSIHPKPQNEALDVEAVWREYVCHEQIWMRCFRAALYALGMFSFGMFVLVPMFGKPTPPVRGDLAYYAYKYTGLIDAILMLCLMFLIFDATLSCLLFVNKLRNRTQWPQTTAGLYEGRLKLQTNLVNDWIGLEFVAKRTKCIGSLIYFPFIMIALLILSRSTIFANYAPSLTILIWYGISLSIVIGCAVMLWWGARETRDIAKKNMTEGIISEKEAEGDPRLAEQLETLLIRVSQLKEGAFRPLPQQPLVRAFLFPLSSAGWVALVQSGMLPGL